MFIFQVWLSLPIQVLGKSWPAGFNRRGHRMGRGASDRAANDRALRFAPSPIERPVSVAGHLD